SLLGFSKELFEISHTLYFFSSLCFFLFVVQFSMTEVATVSVSLAATFTVYIIPTVLSTPFSLFLEVFFKRMRNLRKNASEG
ncbi:MAG: hypothetical protein DBX93_00855, partial [Oscillospiraceae bacterium]